MIKADAMISSRLLPARMTEMLDMMSGMEKISISRHLVSSMDASLYQSLRHVKSILKSAFREENLPRTQAQLLS